MIFGWTGMASARHRRRMFAMLLLLTASIFPQGLRAATVTAISVGADRIVLRFDDAVDDASAFVLDEPQRIALDIAGAEPGRDTPAGGLVSRTRQAQFKPDVARVVFDLVRPAIVTKGAFSDGGKMLTLSLAGVDAGRFASAARKGRQTFLQLVSAARPRSRYSLTIPLEPATKMPALPRISGPAGRPLVVIDAGHGGHDPGSLSKTTGRREKDATLSIALAIRDELIRSGRVRVALTREDDRYLILEERYGIARRLKADLFISIHADSATVEDANGATVYTLSEVASDREAARLAARENRADIINGVNLGGQSPDVSSILIDLTQRETMNVSADFARLLHREATGLVPFRSDYHRFAGFVVLKAPDVPSVLFETGFMSNPTDVDFLFSRDGRRRIADGIARAVEVQFARKMAQQ